MEGGRGGAKPLFEGSQRRAYTPPSQLAIDNLQFLLLLISSSLVIPHSKLQHFRNFTTSSVITWQRVISANSPQF